MQATAAPPPQLHGVGNGLYRPQLPQFARCNWLSGHSYPNLHGAIGYQATATPICTVQLAIRPQLPQLHGLLLQLAIRHSYPNLHGFNGYQATATPICTVQLAIRPQLPQFARCNWLSGHSYPNLHGAIGYQATATPICTVQLAIRPTDSCPNLHGCNLQLAIRPQLPQFARWQLAIRPQLPQLHVHAILPMAIRPTKLPI
eukprot:gene27607-7244_t